jgi:hypothetical protein
MILQYGLLCAAAAAAGAINSVAGGGTLLTFPVLCAFLAGRPDASVMANATSTTALFPGSLAGMWAYRKEFKESGKWPWILVLPSVAGGLCGSLLVTRLPPETFEAVVPWLILGAGGLFWVQPRVSRWLGIGQPHDAPSTASMAGGIVFQFLIGVYGGYFGAGIGILMLASLGFVGLADIHRMNSVKTFLAGCINGMAVAVFITGDKVHWPAALAMAGAAVAGGYFGARAARRLNREWVRAFIVVCAFIVGIVYLVLNLYGG